MCWSADTGSSTSCQKCVQTCCQGAYSTGTTDYFNILANCLCTTGSAPCANACATEYCVTPGSVNQQGDPCYNCLVQYTGTGQTCDTSTGGPIDSACKAQTACNDYITCASGCPGGC